jgi:hypothetical protein
MPEQRIEQELAVILCSPVNPLNLDTVGSRLSIFTLLGLLARELIVVKHFRAVKGFVTRFMHNPV